MNIGIIGSGKVGGTLGTRWAKGGHSVIFSSRNPDSDEMKDLVNQAGPKSRSASVSETTKASDVLVLATPWQGTQEALRNAGSLAGKVLIDVTNPVLPDLSGLEHGNTTSGAEHVAQWSQGAKVVKAFNTVGFNVMANSDFGADRAVLFYCGDDNSAKSVAHTLAADLGFEPIDAGPLTRAHVLEPFALLWILLANVQGFGRNIGFKFLRR